MGSHDSIEFPGVWHSDIDGARCELTDAPGATPRPDHATIKVAGNHEAREVFHPMRRLRLIYAVSFLVLASSPILVTAFASPRTPLRAGPLTSKGTQPGVTYEILPPSECRQCHGTYDTANNIEPWATWAGSMMAHASRDPIFWAALDVANHDVPEVGDFCLRCHLPAAWLAGRSSPPGGSTDGCGMVGVIDGFDEDFDGVSCHLCHRMMENPSPPPGEDPVYYENANFWLDDSDCGTGEPCRRGPYDYSAQGVPPPHPWAFSAYHVGSGICGNCHNVTNTTLTLIKNGVDTGRPMPVERTYAEWLHSGFSDSLSTDYQTCQKCHMPNVTVDSAYACNIPRNNRAGNMPTHQFAGGNAWIPDVLRAEYPALGLDDNFIATRDWTLNMLQNRSAQIKVTGPANIQEGRALAFSVKVTNLTGHKLPTGYPEGRRMWLNVQVRDGLGNLIWESGAYDPATGVLTMDKQAKVYEVKQGIYNLNGTNECDVENGGGAVFHFVRNNCFALDNRIPPKGFTGKDDLDTQPVNYVYPETAPGSGILVNYDITTYALTIPAGTASPLQVSATLRYQTASKEYVEFLRDEAVTNNFPNDCIARTTGTPTSSRGEIVYDMWSRNGQCPPVDMGTALATVVVTEAPKLPTALALDQNYPNPVNAAVTGTRIAFHLPSGGRVHLDIYDVGGRRVRALVNAHYDAGARSAYWDGRNDAGQAVASGVYLYRLEVAGQVLSKRLVNIR